MDAIADASAYVQERFGQPAAAYLAGSAAGERRTATSDLDIVIVREGSSGPYRATERYRGWLVEIFAHTPTSLEHYWERDAASRLPALIRMVAEGHILTSTQQRAEAWQRRARTLLEDGPRALSRDESEARRYQLTALLDDLEGADDDGEIAYVAALLLLKTSELALLSHRRWLGTDKWLFRHLTALDPEGAEELLRAHRATARGHTRDLLGVAKAFIDEAGGPLQEGYTLAGEDPQADP